MKNFGEMEAWAYPGTAQIFWAPLLSQEREKLRILNLIWPVHSQGPSEQRPVKNFREKGAWAYPGTAQFLWVHPIISGTGKATDFKFGLYIQSVRPNKTRHLANRAFVVAAPSSWNCLPDNVRNSQSYTSFFIQTENSLF